MPRPRPSTQAEAALAQARAGADRRAGGGRGGVRRPSAAADAARDALPGAATDDQERQADAQVEQAQAALRRARASRTQARAAVDAAEAGVAAAQADANRASAALDAATAARADRRDPRAVRGHRGLGRAGRRATACSRACRSCGSRTSPGGRFETSDLSETSIARVQPGAAGDDHRRRAAGRRDRRDGRVGGRLRRLDPGRHHVPRGRGPDGEVPAELRWNMTVTMEIEGEPAG